MAILLIIAFSFMLVGYGTFNPKAPINRNILLVVIWLAMSLFWGLSYINAPDIPGYIRFYEQKVFDWSIYGVRIPTVNFEYGFLILSCLVKSVSHQFYVFQLFLFSTELALVMMGLRKLFQADRTIIFICALFFVLPLNLLSALRQGIAISIFIFSLSFIIERKLWKYILAIVIASFFHKSSLFLLPLYWIIHVRGLLHQKKILWGILLVLDLLYFFGFSMSAFLDKMLLLFISSYDNVGSYVSYANGEIFTSNFGVLKILEMNVVYILLLCFDSEEESSKAKDLLKLLFIAYFVLNMLMGGILAHRIGYYFAIVYQVSLVASFCVLTRRALGRPETGYLIVCFYSVLLNVLYLQGGLSGKLVYRNLFWEHLINGTY